MRNLSMRIAGLGLALLIPSMAMAQTASTPVFAPNPSNIRSSIDGLPIGDQSSRPFYMICQSGCSSPTVPANFAPAQVSVSTTATLVAALRSGRQTITVENTGTTAVYLGPTSSVTTSTGTLLPGVVGASVTLSYSGAVYGVVASGSQTVAEFELY